MRVPLELYDVNTTYWINQDTAIVSMRLYGIKKNTKKKGKHGYKRQLIKINDMLQI